MDDQRRYSRWRRLPGVHRITDRRLPDHRSEPQRLTIYVNGGVLDDAEALAARAGVGTVQEYCEHLLTATIRAEVARSRVEQVEMVQGRLGGLDAIADDPEYLAEWNARHVGPHPATVAIPGLGTPALDRPDDGASDELGRPLAAAVEVVLDQLPALGGETPLHILAGAVDVPGASMASESGEGSGVLDPAAVVQRHAGAGTGPELGWLASLRRGEPATPAVAGELLRALSALERELGPAGSLDRSLAYALHRMAFEGQVLLTDAWPQLASDQSTVDLLRLVQEAVDRILSGQDIRYDRPAPDPEALP